MNQLMGKELYTAYVANHPDMHSSRFPTWDELDMGDRYHWHNRALSWEMLRRAYPSWPISIQARISLRDLPYMTWDP